MLNSLSIKLKLIILTFLVAIGFLVTVVVTSKGMNSAIKSISEISDDNIVSILGLMKIMEGHSTVNYQNVEVWSYENVYTAQADFEELIAHKLKGWEEIKIGFDMYSKTPKTADESALWETFLNDWDAWVKLDAMITKDILTSLAKNIDPLKQKELYLELSNLSEELESIYHKAEDSLEKIVHLNEKLAVDISKQSIKDMENTQTISLIVSIVILLIIIINAILILNSILSSVQLLKTEMTKVSENQDLTVTIQYNSNDELKAIVNGFNSLTQKLRDAIKEAKNSSNENASVSSELSSTSNQIGQNAEGQVKIIQDTIKRGK